MFRNIRLQARAKLLGLDMPAKTAPTDPSGEREVLLLAGAGCL
jgi:hypothetical protein